MKTSARRGFTLLEVMVAVAIFAIVSAALIKNATQTVYQTRLIQERSLAYWIAENQLNEIRSQSRENSNYPSPGSDRRSVVMANKDWEIVVDYESTENADMRRVIVSVFHPEDLDNRVVELTGFVGRY
ncbi:MAG: general secretion pathway protein I [Candidatus Azotimanducaceae bacterium]|jgi:general secretion pathway protein I